MSGWKRLVRIAAVLAVVSIVGLAGLYYAYLRTRKDYPIRNELYRCVETVTIYGAEGRESQTEKDSVTEISEGYSLRATPGDETDASNVLRNVYIATSKRTYRTDSFQYRLNDAANTTIAAATRKDIKDRAVIDVGRRNLQQLSASLLDRATGKHNEVFFIREQDPEIRATQWHDTFLVDGRKEERIAKMIEGRSLGGLLGQSKRAFTEIDFYKEDTPVVFLFSKETGLLDWLPQSSTVSLFSKPPGLLGRVKNLFQGGSEALGYRVRQYFDIKAHWDNGGYYLTDRYGALARVHIRDFYLFYGDDLLYQYYIDKDGDGRLRDEELVGKVLVHKSADRTPAAGGDAAPEARQITAYTLTYSFMAGSRPESGVEDFLLCNAIEFAMPDQINKGMGKDSHLGLIEQKRDDILLYGLRSARTLHNALLAEDPLDVGNLSRLLKGANRPYAEQVQRRIAKELPPSAVPVLDDAWPPQTQPP